MMLSYNRRICQRTGMPISTHNGTGGYAKFTPRLIVPMREDREVSFPGID